MRTNTALRRDVVTSRPSFLANSRPTWRANLAVLLLVIGLVQFMIFIVHLVWLAERWVWAFLRSL